MGAAIAVQAAASIFMHWQTVASLQTHYFTGSVSREEFSEQLVSFAEQDRVAETRGPLCRARHQDCCCCWPIPKDVPAPIGPKLPKPVLTAQLLGYQPVLLADAEWPRFGGEWAPSSWQSHSERQSTLCAWLK